MKSTLFTVVALGAALALPAGAQSRTRIDTTFAFDKSGAISLDLPTGAIRVTAWARNEIRVVAVSERLPIVSTFSPRRVSLVIRGRSGGGRAQYDVTVPIGVRVVAKVAAGSVNVSGTRGELMVIASSAKVEASETAGFTEINSGAGDVRVQRATGSTAISTANGDVTINEIDGDLDITTIVGDVTIQNANLSNLDFKSTAGEFDFSGQLAEKGRHHISSNSGEVTFRLPATFGATFQLEAYQGSIHAIDFPMNARAGNNANRNRNGERREVMINGGGAVILVNTFSGEVYLRKIVATRR